MDCPSDIDSWIAQAKAGDISWTQVAEKILAVQHPAESEHQPDTDRGRRCGFGEVIFGENKSSQAIISIARKLLETQSEILVTRCDQDKLAFIAANFNFSRYDSAARILRLSDRPIASVNSRNSQDSSNETLNTINSVMVVTAGSTDLPVAREALETLRWMGVDSQLLTDVGVAGPYRLLPHLNRLRNAVAIVVCAGMEGALASVLGGLVPCPIIAVPTSVGYGFNLGGVTTLLSMMSSCAAGVTVVNIDAGFKGGYVAGLIAARKPTQL